MGKLRGFAFMAATDPKRLKEISAHGGREGQRTKKAHRWTKKEAQAMGKLGGEARVANLKDKS
jgi:hypothetical protein